MQPRFVTKPAFTVVGKVIHTAPMTAEIPELWQDFGSWAGAVQHMAEPHVAYGLMDHMDQELGKFDYMAAVAVQQVDDLPSGLSSWDIPEKTYAVFEATLPTIPQVFDYIYGNWFPTSGYQQAHSPSFERYGETFNPDDPTSKLAIYIPVESQA